MVGHFPAVIPLHLAELHFQRNFSHPRSRCPPDRCSRVLALPPPCKLGALVYTNKGRNAHLWRKTLPGGDSPAWVITTAVDVASTAFLKGALIPLAEELRGDRPPPVVTMGSPGSARGSAGEQGRCEGWHCDECGQRSPGDLHSWGCTACEECGAAPPSMLEVERRRIGDDNSPLGRAWQSFDLETSQWSAVDGSTSVVAVWCMHLDEDEDEANDGARGGQQSDGAACAADSAARSGGGAVEDAVDDTSDAAVDAASAAPPASFDDGRDSIDVSSMMYSLTGSGGGGDDATATAGDPFEQW